MKLSSSSSMISKRAPAYLGGRGLGNVWESYRGQMQARAVMGACTHGSMQDCIRVIYANQDKDKRLPFVFMYLMG